jgi:hypothetical protein
MTKIEFSRFTDNYFSDVEHDALTCLDNSMYPVRQYLTGTKRIHNELWLDLIRQNIEMDNTIIIYYGSRMEMVMSGLKKNKFIIY